MSHMRGWIALAPVEYDSQRKIIDHPVQQTEIVQAYCIICKREHGYATHDINLCEKDAPVRPWEPHPAFVRSSKKPVIRGQALRD